MYFINHVVLSIVTIQHIKYFNIVLFYFSFETVIFTVRFCTVFFLRMFHSIFALLHVSCVNNIKHYGMLIDTNIKDA